MSFHPRRGTSTQLLIRCWACHSCRPTERSMHSGVSDSLRPGGCSPPGSSVHGTLQARILEWAAIAYSRGSSGPRDQTHVSCISSIGRWILYHCATWEALPPLTDVLKQHFCSFLITTSVKELGDFLSFFNLTSVSPARIWAGVNSFGQQNVAEVTLYGFQSLGSSGFSRWC